MRTRSERPHDLTQEHQRRFSQIILLQDGIERSPSPWPSPRGEGDSVRMKRSPSPRPNEKVRFPSATIWMPQSETNASRYMVPTPPLYGCPKSGNHFAERGPPRRGRTVGRFGSVHRLVSFL